MKKQMIYYFAKVEETQKRVRVELKSIYRSVKNSKYVYYPLEEMCISLNFESKEVHLFNHSYGDNEMAITLNRCYNVKDLIDSHGMQSVSRGRYMQLHADAMIKYCENYRLFNS